MGTHLSPSGERRNKIFSNFICYLKPSLPSSSPYLPQMLGPCPAGSQLSQEVGEQPSLQPLDCSHHTLMSTSLLPTPASLSLLPEALEPS